MRNPVAIAVHRVALGLSLAWTMVFPPSTEAQTIPRQYFIETVESTEDTGKYTSLEVDAHGNAHIAYQAIFNGATFFDLKYAVRQGGTWAIETVDSAGDEGYYASLELDENGDPHICYSDFTNDDLKYAFKQDGVWTIETVDSAGDVGRYCSLALASDGTAHISYFDATNNDLKYAVRVDGAWMTETVPDPDPIVGLFTSITVVDGITPIISYQNFSNACPQQAHKGNVGWTFSGCNGFGGEWTSIAQDSKGGIGISYYDTFNGRVEYRGTIPGGFVGETVWSGYDEVFPRTALSLEFDANDVPHIAFLDGDFGSLQRAVYVNGNWTLETIDSNIDGFTGYYPSLAFDPQGNPVMSYYDSANGNLKVADSGIRLTTSPELDEELEPGSKVKVAWQGYGAVDCYLSVDGGLTFLPMAVGITGGEAVLTLPDVTASRARIWLIRNQPLSTAQSELFTIAPRRVSPWWSATVDANGTTGLYTSLAVSASGAPHISYIDGTGVSELKYAVRTGETWSVETADATLSSTSGYTSLQLDSKGDPHVTYYDSAPASDLKYAVKTGGSWTTEVVDAPGDVGLSSSLELDRQGIAHVSYQDVGNGDLKYAHRTGGSWASETVDSAGTVGNHSSLRLDATGDPHISYHDETNGDLKYATKDDGVWSIEPVDSAGSVGRYTSLALDPRGNPHVSYVDYTDTIRLLKYATKLDGVWNIEVVDETGSVGSAIELDARGNPRISYQGAADGDLRYAVKRLGQWTIESVDADAAVGTWSSLAIDAQGNPHVSYFDFTNTVLKYASGAVGIGSPSAGDVWPVGGTRAVTWDGHGTVDVSLSVDGGSTYTPVATDVSGGRYDLVVPHTPSKFSRVRIERREDANDFRSTVYRRSISESYSLFTIEASITLLNMLAVIPEDKPGLLVSWNTEPGPEDLSGYRLQRKATDGTVTSLLTRTRQTRYHDPDGQAGDVYQLFVINGLGDEFYLGEERAGGAGILADGLAVYPTPYRGGNLTIEFATAFGNQPMDVEVAVFDVAGRRVATVAEGVFPGPTHRTIWNGTDQRGRAVGRGIYFVRAATSFGVRTNKLVVVR